MKSQIIPNLPSEVYHHSPPYNEYISSSLLKLYQKSPLAYKYAIDNPQEDKSKALEFGTLFHDCMALLSDGVSLETIKQHYKVFDAPINEKTGQPYGATTKAYKEAYDAFIADNSNYIIIPEDEYNTLFGMLNSLVNSDSATSQQVQKLLKWGTAETSFFYENDEGVKIKCRPDLETKSKIIDWKTYGSDDLSEDALNKAILKYGYHISCAMYQDIVYRVTGVWKPFILVFVSKIPPYDCIMVDMSYYGYRYLPEIDMVTQGCGALEYKRLLDLHTKCIKSNEWHGAESQIKSDSKFKLLEIIPPTWYNNKFIDE